MNLFILLSFKKKNHKNKKPNLQFWSIFSVRIQISFVQKSTCYIKYIYSLGFSLVSNEQIRSCLFFNTSLNTSVFLHPKDFKTLHGIRYGNVIRSTQEAMLYSHYGNVIQKYTGSRRRKVGSGQVKMLHF